MVGVAVLFESFLHHEHHAAEPDILTIAGQPWPTEKMVRLITDSVFVAPGHGDVGFPSWLGITHRNLLPILLSPPCSSQISRFTARCSLTCRRSGLPARARRDAAAQ